MIQQGYIKSLDGVRALAIIMVMAFHAGILQFGWMGVQLFFVLSGYLITSILWKDKFQGGPVSGKFKKFWARRILRIFPLYFGFLLVIGLIYLLTRFPSYFPASAPYLFTYTYNYTRLQMGWIGNPLFTHLWSLSIEEQFYLLYPFLIFFLKPTWIRYILIACILLSPCIRYLLFDYYQRRTDVFTAADAVYWNTLSHLDAFFLGGLIPVLALDMTIKRPYIFLYFTFSLALVAGLINYFSQDSSFFLLGDLGYNFEKTGNGAPVWRYSLLNFFFSAFILCLTSKVAGRSSWLVRICSNRWLVRMGKVSYGMYVFHWALFIYLFTRFNPSHNWRINVTIFLPYLLLVYLLAEFSFIYYESKFLLLKDKWFPMKESMEPMKNTLKPFD